MDGAAKYTLEPHSVTNRTLDDISPPWSNQIFFQRLAANAIDNGSITGIKLAENAITKVSQVIATGGDNGTQNVAAAAGMTNITNATGTFTSEDGGDLILMATFGAYKSTAASAAHFRVVIGSNNYPDATGWAFYWNTVGEHQSHTYFHVVSPGLTAGSYSCRMQMSTAADSISDDSQDWYSLTILELKR